MRLRSLSPIVLLLHAHHLAAWILDTSANSVYQLQDEYVGQDFFNFWRWDTFADPTHGRVNYVSKDQAIAKNLSFASECKFVMSADSSTIVQPSSRGRDSVRVVSNAAYDEAVIVLSLSHMPEGCATWPAFWSVSQAGPWPSGGEIDIIEGVNTNVDNLSSLHTSPNCIQSVNSNQSGRATSLNCDASLNYNTGCGVAYTRPNSYGSGLNANGGGWYAMQRSRTAGINIWFRLRSDTSVPWRTAQGTYPQVLSIDSSWGKPDVHFDLGKCDYPSHFDAHNFIFDITFCGDWAGSAFPSSGCGTGSCESFVNNQPEAFKNAYWEINSLLVYTPRM